MWCYVQRRYYPQNILLRLQTKKYSTEFCKCKAEIVDIEDKVTNTTKERQSMAQKITVFSKVPSDIPLNIANYSDWLAHKNHLWQNTPCNMYSKRHNVSIFKEIYTKIIGSEDFCKY